MVELGLTDLLRKKLAETAKISGLSILEMMITGGRGPIRDCAFRFAHPVQVDLRDNAGRISEDKPQQKEV